MNFTPRAQQVIALARKEADRLNHDVVDIEHLVLGMVKLNQGVHIAVFERLNVDIAALVAKIERESTHPSGERVIGNIPYTAEVKKALALAGREAKGLNHSYVGTEHLLLGLLRLPETAVGRALGAFGLELEAVRLAIREELVPSSVQTTARVAATASRKKAKAARSTQNRDIDGEPSGLFEREPIGADEQARSAFVAGPAGYHSDYRQLGRGDRVDDYLNVALQARQLAELIALRETRLPLAVGLFGDWGSGKSHFMSLMDQHIRELAESEDTSPNAASGRWCRHIVPIYFNAWHYLDANLWASLVTEIFDKLFTYLAPHEDQLKEIQRLLVRAGGAVARAEEEVTQARTASNDAAQQLAAAKAEKGAAQGAITGLLDSLATLVPRVNTPENRQHLSRLLGIDAEVATLSTLMARRGELQSASGRARELWRRATAPKGLATRLGWLGGTIIVVPGVIWIAATLEPQLLDWLQRIRPSVKAVLVAITGAGAWLTPVWTELQRRLREMETLQRDAEQAQKRLSDSDALRAARERLDAANAATAEAEAKLAKARAHAEKLERAAKELHPERRLSVFIEERARSTEYRGQLGLVSLVRRDFQELSDLFSNAEALRSKEQTLGAADAAKLKKLSCSVDRIVLFIDDLDRCQADTIVDVLQAVHLLLAFPLFAVVVGVDQRCLKHSLEKQFEGLVGNANANTNVGHKSPATSLDYLEKIFHIPFHLPSMNEVAFGNLVEKLTSSNETQREAVVSATGDLHEETKEAVDVPHGAPDLPLSAPQPQKIVGSVPLEHWERQALKDYHPLIRTPRGATRLLNTYRLVRAGVPADDWHDFCGNMRRSGEFRIAMLLLASAAGSPAVARAWFGRIRDADASALFLSESEGASTDEGWSRFKLVFDATFEHSGKTLTRDLFLKWIARVERFAF